MSLTVSSSTVRRFIRYGSVSAISTGTSLAVLGLLVFVGWPATVSNVLATAVGTVPSFELNRRWVWVQGEQRSWVHQVLPYCLLSLAGLVVSTAAVHVAADATHASSRLVHTGAVEGANLGAYGALWLIQFALCDRVLFRTRATASPPSAECRRVRRRRPDGMSRFTAGAQGAPVRVSGGASMVVDDSPVGTAVAALATGRHPTDSPTRDKDTT
jgi:putative flippase GtrA